MRAWRVRELGEPADVMVLEDIEQPVPSRGQVLVRVAAAALNFTDVLYCRGEYQIRAEPPFTPGSEVSGTVEAVGEGVDDVAPGDRVIGVTGVGGLAEAAAVLHAYPIPDTLDWTSAAALHVTYQTAHCGLHQRGRLQSGETLLVHAGSGRGAPSARSCASTRHDAAAADSARRVDLERRRALAGAGRPTTVGPRSATDAGGSGGRDGRRCALVVGSRAGVEHSRASRAARRRGAARPPCARARRRRVDRPHPGRDRRTVPR